MFEKCGRTTTDDDGRRRTPDNGYTISSPYEPEGSGELKKVYPRKPQFYYIKVGVRGSSLHGLDKAVSLQSLLSTKYKA